MKTYLAYDIARCTGKKDFEPCKDCARQVFNKPEHCGSWQPWTGPTIKDGECVNKIPMDEE